MKTLLAQYLKLSNYWLINEPNRVALGKYSALLTEMKYTEFKENLIKTMHI